MSDGGEGGPEGARVGQGPARAKSGRFIKQHGDIVLEQPDIPGGEFTQRRSFRIQDGVNLFLEQNVDTAWETRESLNIRAANYVYELGLLRRKPSLVTADRWIKQATVVGDPTCEYRVRYVTERGYYVLERADWPTLRMRSRNGNANGGGP